MQASKKYENMLIFNVKAPDNYNSRMTIDPEMVSKKMPALGPAEMYRFLEVQKGSGLFRLANTKKTVAVTRPVIQKHIFSMKESPDNFEWRPLFEQKNLSKYTERAYKQDIDWSLMDNIYKTTSHLRESCKDWNLNHIDGYLNDMLDGDRIAGVSTSMMYFGTKGDMSSFHTEDLDVNSVSYLYPQSANKVWIAVHPDHRQKLEDIMNRQLDVNMSNLPIRSKEGFCIMPLNHKYMIVSVDFLEEEGIPYQFVVQKPGTFVFTRVGVLHQVVNAGFNLAEAVNFTGMRYHVHARRREFHCCRKQRQNYSAPAWLKLINPLTEGENEMESCVKDFTKLVRKFQTESIDDAEESDEELPTSPIEPVNDTTDAEHNPANLPAEATTANNGEVTDDDNLDVPRSNVSENNKENEQSIDQTNDKGDDDLTNMIDDSEEQGYYEEYLDDLLQAANKPLENIQEEEEVIETAEEETLVAKEPMESHPEKDDNEVEFVAVVNGQKKNPVSNYVSVTSFEPNKSNDGQHVGSVSATQTIDDLSIPSTTPIGKLKLSRLAGSNQYQVASKEKQHVLVSTATTVGLVIVDPPIAAVVEPVAAETPIAASVEPMAVDPPITVDPPIAAVDPPIAAVVEPVAAETPIAASVEPMAVDPPITAETPIAAVDPPIAAVVEPVAAETPIAASVEPMAVVEPVAAETPIAASVEPMAVDPPITAETPIAAVDPPIAAVVEPVAAETPIAASVEPMAVDPPITAETPIAASVEPMAVDPPITAETPIAAVVEPVAAETPIAASVEPMAVDPPITVDPPIAAVDPPIAAVVEPVAAETPIAAADEPIATEPKRKGRKKAKEAGTQEAGTKKKKRKAPRKAPVKRRSPKSKQTIESEGDDDEYGDNVPSRNSPVKVTSPVKKRKAVETEDERRPVKRKNLSLTDAEAQKLKIHLENRAKINDAYRSQEKERYHQRKADGTYKRSKGKKTDLTKQFEILIQAPNRQIKKCQAALDKHASCIVRLSEEKRKKYVEQLEKQNVKLAAIKLRRELTQAVKKIFSKESVEHRIKEGYVSYEIVRDFLDGELHRQLMINALKVVKVDDLEFWKKSTKTKAAWNETFGVDENYRIPAKEYDTVSEDDAEKEEETADEKETDDGSESDEEE